MSDTDFFDSVSITIQDEPKRAKRFNEGKVDLSLLPTEALRQEAMVWMSGEKKYGRDNWKSLWGADTMSVCLASALRHMLGMMDGELVDQESGLPHAAHVRCNMAMILEYMKNQK
jgi:hypothetical protein